LSELEDKVEEVFATVEELREVAGDGPATRRLLDALFRTVHSLKASATTNGLGNLAAAAHEFENLLYALRTGKSAVDNDAFQGLGKHARSLFKSLTDDKPSATIPAEIWSTLKEAEKHTLKQSVAEGATLFLVQTRFDVTDFDRQFQSLKDLLSQTGEVISTAPKVDPEQPGKINFRILYARSTRADQTLLELSGIENVRAEEVSVLLPQPAAFVRRHTADSVRVSLEDLDRVISSTHKLFNQTTGAKANAAEIERGLLDLSAELVNLRVVPLESTLQRALRAGRSAAVATRKEIDFEIRGQDLLLDRSLAEAIADPLVHLVRNAVDHGIEDSESRTRLSKPGRGKVLVEAASFQGQTRITVTDDGRGIDPEVVAKAAKRLGVVAGDAIVNTEKCIRLLFRAGFSTAPEVSNISGRGIGLDVVETGVESVGGSVRVNSRPGKGSTFEILLPVTFGFQEVVAVTVCGQRYLIDASHVVSKAAGQEDVNAVRLSSLLGKPVDDRQGQSSAALLCQVADRSSDQIKQTTLIVDEIGETQHALVRGLGSRSSRWFGVSGASELRDGSVSLLLDLPRLILRLSKGP
jgi:two-component system chemotaxis sensor kinase CheA